MKIVTITPTGQIKLDADLLHHLGVRPGGQVVFDKLPGREITLRAVRPTGKIEDAFGCLKREGQRPISIEEMNEIIEKGWAGEL